MGSKRFGFVWRHKELLYLLLLILVGVFLRVYRLDSLPPGFHFDLAFNARDIARLMHGDVRIFFPANTGREPLFIYLQAAFAYAFGLTEFGLTLASVFVGVTTIPLVYAFTKSLLRDEKIALLAATFTAISFWHVFYSRYGLRVILVVPLTLLTFWFLWLAVRRRNSRMYALSGAAMALAVYTYPSARLLPLGVGIVLLFVILSDRGRAKDYFKGLLVFLGVSAILIAPLAWYFAQHPDEFFSHTFQVSVLSPDAKNSDVASAIWGNILRVLGMFFITGDNGLLRNLPGRPVFDPLLGALFVVGVVVLFIRLFRPRAAFLERLPAVILLTWLLVSLVTSVFSDDAPNFLRTLPALPAVMILPAWGAGEIWERIQRPILKNVYAVVLIGVILFSAGIAVRDYFVSFANAPSLYYVFDADKVEIANWINANAPTNRIWLAPLYYQQGTISLLTRTTPLDSFESRDTIVLPSASGGKGAIYVFPLEQQQKLRTLAARLGDLGQSEVITGTNGAPLMNVYRVPTENLPDAANPIPTLQRGGEFLQTDQFTRVQWQANLELIGYSIEASDKAGRNLMVTLFMHALAPIANDYTFSVQVVDDKQRVWGQEDKWAGDNSYATSQWKAGDVIVERFYPGLNACAPEGTYHLTVQAYDPKTNTVLPIVGQNEPRADLGSRTAQLAASNRLEDLEPAYSMEARIAPGLQLLGYSLTPEAPKPGEPFSLSLFWKGTATPRTNPIHIHVRDSSGQDVELSTRTLTTPSKDRGSCSFFDLQLPTDTMGASSLFVNETKITQLELR
ncbi:MAG TPA: glycosyltransferase family 39 protein [Anaerolineae bacterium]|nr:glycosyltransferase family 39 protein [Anaerolineae bacterium]